MLKTIGIAAGVVIAAVMGLWAAGADHGYLMPLGRPTVFAGNAILPALLIGWIVATLFLPKKKGSSDQLSRNGQGTVRPGDHSGG
jgi:hypothetical protein